MSDETAERHAAAHERHGHDRADAATGIRPYLEIRTASPSSWAPDGSALLISSDLPGTAQVHRLDLPADLPVLAAGLVALTRFEEPVGAGYLPADPHAERDGGADGDAHRLLLASDRGGNERHQLFTMPAHVEAPRTGLDELDPLVVDNEHIHRPGGVTRDGRWLAYATNRANDVDFDTWVRDLTTGEERRVWAPGAWTSGGGFSPDGRYLAVSELTTRAGDNRVHLLDLEALGDEPADHDAAAAVELAPHDDAATVGAPSWLPDGSAFFFATDVDREFVGIARGSPDGPWQYVIEPGWDAGCAVDWAGRHLLVVVNDDGRSRAVLHDPHTLEVTAEVPLPDEHGVAGGWSLSKDGRYLAFAYSSATHPGDAWRYDTDTGELERLTASPGEVDPAAFVAPELIRYRSFDGLEVPAFVFRPQPASPPGHADLPDAGAPQPTTPRPAAPHPVVVVIHGGPESQWRPSFSPLTQYLVAQGFAVVAPNVRGSTGYGRSYQHLDDVDKRLDSVHDLAGLHDWLAGQDDLDETRAALYGGSYGGYMVLMGLTHQPERWAAGVDIVGMSDLVTFLENTAAWRRAFREREYGSLEHDRDLLRELSPISHVESLAAPLFIVHGANDPRVPLGEAEQMHAILAERGITSELLVYEDEGHGLAKLSNRIDAYPRIAAFLHDVLGAARTGSASSPGPAHSADPARSSTAAHPPEPTDEVDHLVTHHQWIVDGLRMHVAEAGDPDGMPVVLLHGFPDFWYSWRRQIPALVEAGHRVLAPDLRGYADTEAPPRVRAYRLERLVADVAALITDRVDRPVVLVGHDWGGAVAWASAAAHPELISRLAVCNMPHPRRFQQALRGRQALTSWYIGAFQLPLLPEALLRARDGALLRRVLREGATRPGSFTDADLDRYVAALTRRGDLTGPLAYYRAAARGARRHGLFGGVAERVAQPTLVLWGERDIALRPELADPPADLVPDAEVVRIPNAGHWVHLDAADQVNAELLRFAGT